MEALGIAAGMPHVRLIQGSRLWELRSRRRNHHRVFYVA
ncbi:MAG: type II toxin-antitoxin system RelE/ParE family toxin, partial [Chloroflexia bacterium]|nr:type II toxin-antitoxin system RelE/ParE family toxin [Chloroflexia bacterium]